MAHVQLYDFAAIPMANSTLSTTTDERVTLTYDDDLTDSVTFSLDRTNVPRRRRCTLPYRISG